MLTYYITNIILTYDAILIYTHRYLCGQLPSEFIDYVLNLNKIKELFSIKEQTDLLKIVEVSNIEGNILLCCLSDSLYIYIYQYGFVEITNINNPIFRQFYKNSIIKVII